MPRRKPLPIDLLALERGIQTPNALATASGVAPQTIARIRQGRSVRSDSIARLAAFLGLTTSAMSCVVDATASAVRERAEGQ